MKNYVISLTTAQERRTHIMQEFGKQGIEFEFFDAITPEQINGLSQKFNLYINNSALTKGELGCLFSHLSLWQKMIDENINYIAIFEDDVHLGENIPQFLNSHDWIKSEYKLIKLEKFYDTLILGQKHQVMDRKICKLKQSNLGTAGYIIQKDMAKALLEYTKNTFEKQTIPIDHIMFDVFLSNPEHAVYQLEPALCIQSDRLDKNSALKSRLESEREKLRQNLEANKIKPTFLQKLAREIKRVFRNIHYLIHREKVSFK